MPTNQPFATFPDIIAAFSRRQDGNMSLTYGQTSGALKHREIFLDKLRINYEDLVCAKQVHGNRVEYVTPKDKGKGALTYDTAVDDTDAFITDGKYVPLAIFTADCLLVFFYDPVKKAIGLAHAGWRSSSKNIAAETIKRMQEKFQSRPQDIYAAFGPAMRDCCFVVEEDFKEYFSSGIIKRGNRYYLDLIAVNKGQLTQAGVREANISDCGLCTYCYKSEFFSFRREGEASGRMVSVIML